MVTFGMVMPFKKNMMSRASLNLIATNTLLTTEINSYGRISTDSKVFLPRHINVKLGFFLQRKEFS